MGNVLSLATPFFGVVFIGFFCGKLLKYPEDGLRWMNFFIVYIALPAMFFKLISEAPIEQLTNWRYVAITVACSFSMFVVCFIIGMFATDGNKSDSTIAAVAGAYGNVGYMGPGIALAALGQGGVVPAALITVTDTVLFFTLVPFMMAVTGGRRESFAKTASYVVRRIVTHPFNVATALGILAASVGFKPHASIDATLVFLKNAAAPCALFTLGVTVALRPLERVPNELPALMAVKLFLHPALVWLAMSWAGDFGRDWTLTAVLLASLPPALNVFVLAGQYRVYVERASSAVLLGTIVSVASVTGLLWLITEGGVPYDLFP